MLLSGFLYRAQGTNLGANKTIWFGKTPKAALATNDSIGVDVSIRCLGGSLRMMSDRSANMATLMIKERADLVIEKGQAVPAGRQDFQHSQISRAGSSREVRFALRDQLRAL
jgi:hypothetical protein